MIKDEILCFHLFLESLLEKILVSLSFTGKVRKASSRSQNSSAELGANYPTLPLTRSTEALQQERARKHHPTIVAATAAKHFLLCPPIKALRGLGRGVRRCGALMPASRSCEMLDGPFETPNSSSSSSNAGAGARKRSQSLGDLLWEQGFDQQQKPQRGPPVPQGPGANEGATDTEGSERRKKKVGEVEEGGLTPADVPAVPALPPRPAMTTTRSPPPPVSHNVTLSPFRKGPPASHDASFVSPMGSPLTSPPTSPPLRTLPKKPPVPPPVPVKKSKEQRLPNGVRPPPPAHLLPALPVKTCPSSPPEGNGNAPTPTHTPTLSPTSPSLSPEEAESEPGSPPSVPPPWLADLPESRPAMALRRVSKMADLETLLEERLVSEGIDLTQEPYSDKVSRSSSRGAY